MRTPQTFPKKCLDCPVAVKLTGPWSEARAKDDGVEAGERAWRLSQSFTSKVMKAGGPEKAERVKWGKDEGMVSLGDRS